MRAAEFSVSFFSMENLIHTYFISNRKKNSQPSKSILSLLSLLLGFIKWNFKHPFTVMIRWIQVHVMIKDLPRFKTINSKPGYNNCAAVKRCRISRKETSQKKKERNYLYALYKAPGDYVYYTVIKHDWEWHCRG